MKILSIETSCDETGISILEVKGNKKSPVFKVLANSLNSQIKIHAPFGGVFPALAKREHQKNLPILLERTLKKVNFNSLRTVLKKAAKDSPFSAKNPGIDFIAVTSGPGLEPALWTGIVFAKELSKKWQVPVIPINHMEGHILSVFGIEKGKFKIPLNSSKNAQIKIKFPILSLLVSGGHTELVLIESFGKYKIIGETLDDAAGEAFDKVARMLELPYPGGPEISKLAENLRKKGEGSLRTVAIKDNPFSAISLPRPMLYSKNLDFSFSGLKTAVLYLIRDLKKENPNIFKDEKIKQAIACEFENAVIETLVYKTKKAIEKYKIQTVIVAGGVSANKYLKKEMQKITKYKQKLFFPSRKLSGDNSIMIGIAGYFKFIKNKTKKFKIKAEGGLRL